MEKLLQSEKVRKIIRFVQPWVTALIILLILRYTGILSGMSELTGNVLMKTGAMDYDPEEVLKKENFDYNFSIKDLQGNTVDFNQYKGKVVFLNLWATWCGPCRYEMPSIQSLYNSIEDKDKIIFVMISLDVDENKHKVVRYIQDKEFSFPVYMPSGRLTKQLAVPTIPTTFIISQDGIIASKKVGAANYDTPRFKKFLEELNSKTN